MKMKILIIFLFFTGIIFISYVKSNKEEINYTIIGEKELFSNNIISKNFSDLIYDELSKKNSFGFYSKEFTYKNIRTIDMINNINNNVSIDNIYIQNILKRTNVLIINTGNNEIIQRFNDVTDLPEINYKLSKVDSNENNDNEIYNYLDEVYKDIKVLIEKVKDLNEGKIIFLGIYNDTGNKDNDKYYKYINEKLELLMHSNDIDYLNLFDVLNKNEDYLTKGNNIYITNEGNIAIFNKLYRKIDQLYLHKQR